MGFGSRIAWRRPVWRSLRATFQVTVGSSLPFTSTGGITYISD